MKLDPEKYEDYGEEEISRSGGGRRKPFIDPKSLAAQAKREEIAGNSKEKRVDDARERIVPVVENLSRHTIEHNLERVLEEYVAWVNLCMVDNSLYFDADKDVDYETFRSSGAGGQNVNKVSSGVRARHNISGIFSRSTVSRDQPVNKADATSKLINQLTDHLKDWRTVLTGGDNKTQARLLTRTDLE